MTAAQPLRASPSTPTPTLLRTPLLLDNYCQRAISATYAHGGELLLTMTAAALDDPIDALAAEPNHEPNRYRQRQLDTAYDTLTAATNSPRW